MSRLTQNQVNTAAPSVGCDRMLSDGNGLYLRVQPGGAKSWVFRYRANGKAEKLRLGSIADLDLFAARAQASQHRKAVREGGNPLAERKAVRASPQRGMTVREFGPMYMDERIRGTSNYKQPEEVQRMLTAYVYPTMGDVLLWRVDKSMASEPLFNLVKRGKRVMANRLLAQMKAFFAHAANRGYVDASPLASLTAKEVGGKESARQRKLTPAEVWKIFRMLDDSATKYAWQTRDALRLILLTGQRSGEVLGALTRTNLSRDGTRWTIPLGYFKSSKHHTVDHTVHLSAQAQYAIETAWHRADATREALFIDTANEGEAKLKHHPATVRGLSHAVRSMLQPPTPAAAVASETAKRRRVGAGPLHPMKHWTPHDLRRTFATAAGEIGILPHVIEKCLNHKLEGILATYQQGDNMAERAEAMALWGGVVDELLSRPIAPDAEMGWADLRPRPTAQVFAYPPRAA